MKRQRNPGSNALMLATTCRVFDVEDHNFVGRFVDGVNRRDRHICASRTFEPLQLSVACPRMETRSEFAGPA